MEGACSAGWLNGRGGLALQLRRPWTILEGVAGPPLHIPTHLLAMAL
jgi:hypothetical protein